jgi:hypothetical protein
MEIYHLCPRKSEVNRDIQRETERGRDGEREREIERAWPTMRSKEWGRLGWTDLDRQSARESIECVDRGPNRAIYHLCVRESEVNRDLDKESEIERVWAVVRKKE